MSTIAVINSVQTLKRYKKVGYTQEQAEEQVEILQEATEEIFRKIKEDAENTKALTEGKFLYEIEKLRLEFRSEIQKSKNETLLWLFGMLTTFTGIIFAITKFVK
jgi:actin-related protein